MDTPEVLDTALRLYELNGTAAMAGLAEALEAARSVWAVACKHVRTKGQVILPLRRVSKKRWDAKVKLSFHKQRAALFFRR